MLNAEGRSEGTADAVEITTRMVSRDPDPGVSALHACVSTLYHASSKTKRPPRLKQTKPYPIIIIIVYFDLSSFSLMRAVAVSSFCGI